MRFRYLIFALISAVAHAACTSSSTTLTAASCSQSDVQACLSAVTSATTQVNIPACSSGTAWTSEATLTVPSGSSSLSIIGAGSLTTTGGGDQTVLIDNINRSSSDIPMLAITALSGATELRIAGITFKTNGSSQESYNGSLSITSSSITPALVRIDHSHLALTLDGKQATMGGCVYGVMDHSILDLTSATTNNGIFFDQNTCGGSSPAVGNGQWNQATNPGSEQSFYLENDVFNGGVSSSSNIAPFIDDCSGGGRFVVRFSTMNGVELQGHATGHSDNPPDRGCRAYEIYQNTFTGGTTTWPASAGFFDTSGTGMIWGNDVTGYYKDFVAGDVDRTSSGTYTQSATPNGWGYCSSSAIGGVGGPSNWDQNTSGQNGWACLDGMGRGVGDLLTGSFPTVCDSTLGCSTYNGQWPNQASEPIYEWLDAWTTVPGWGSPFWSQTDSQTQQNRDYYLSSNVGSGANCTGFTGATGVGCGTRASRPSNCTTGVAYWSTDQGSWNTSGSGGQGVLDKCTATNIWTNAFYTPYTYPHPLDGGVTTYTLTVSTTGTGSGTLGGTNCTTGSYASGTSVTCTEVPNAGSVFAGWSGGACTGTGSCSFSLTSNSTVTATFNIGPPAATGPPVIIAIP